MDSNISEKQNKTELPFDGKYLGDNELAQNIYEKKLNWVGRGRWAVLEEGCRIPQQHLALINQFSETFLKQFTKDTENPKIVEPEEKQLFLFPTESKFYYKQCVNFDATENP